MWWGVSERVLQDQRLFRRSTLSNISFTPGYEEPDRWSKAS